MQTRVLTKMRIIVSLLTTLTVTLMVGPSRAQEITGTPGSPSATTTINGEQIPAPPEKFNGKIERTIPLILAWDENLDVGSDTGTPSTTRTIRCRSISPARWTRSR
jgi:hypothetical protein